MAATGAWVAYDPQGGASSPMIASSEIQALRYGVEHGMSVVPWPFGLTLEAAIAAAKKTAG